MDKELGSIFLLVTRNWSSGQGSLIAHGLWFCTLIWAFNSSISTQLHLQLSIWWLVPKTLTFPKLPFPIARKISKWSKVTARKSKHFNIKWLSRHLMISCYFYFFSVWAEKNEGCPGNFLFLLKIWVFFKLGFNKVFLSLQFSHDGKLLRSASVNGRSGRKPPSEYSCSALLRCLFEILASPCSCWEQIQSWVHKTLVSHEDTAITFSGMMAQSNHSKVCSDQLQHSEGTQAFRHRCPFSKLEQL